MPTMPENDAGWRIDPPVSVPTAPEHSRAATAAAEPPDEPPGTSFASDPRRRHGETTGPKQEVSFDEPMANSSLLSLPSITAPSRQRLALTVEFVSRDEVLQDVRAGGGAHACGAEHVLDAERDAGERAALAVRQRRIGTCRHLARPLRGLENEGVERTCAAHCSDVGLGEFRRRNFPLAQETSDSARVREVSSLIPPASPRRQSARAGSAS